MPGTGLFRNPIPMKATPLTLISLFALNLSLHAATLRSLGAKGDGTTDDREAIEAALKQSAGQPLDGLFNSQGRAVMVRDKGASGYHSLSGGRIDGDCCKARWQAGLRLR